MGFYSWDRKPDAGSVGTDPVLGRGSVASVAELDIEKKWLQLVKIDKEQFSFFFDKYHDKIFKYVFLRVDDHDLAGELTGEVFTLAWRRVGRFTWQGYSFGAWLFQIARGVISHEFRRQRVRREIEFIPEIHGDIEQATPESAFSDRLDRELVRRGVASLPEVTQDVFVLSYWMGMSRAQVALVLKIPAGTVSSHLGRGRQSLAVWLRRQGLEGGLSSAIKRVVEDQIQEDSGLRVVVKKAEAESEA